MPFSNKEDEQKKSLYAAGLDDEGLKAAQSQADQQRRAATTAEGFAQIGAGISRRDKFDNSFYQKQREEAEQIVKDHLLRRQAQDAERQAQKVEMENTKTATGMGSTGPEAEAYRALLGSTTGHSVPEGVTLDDMRGISGNLTSLATSDRGLLKSQMSAEQQARLHAEKLAHQEEENRKKREHDLVKARLLAKNKPSAFAETIEKDNAKSYAQLQRDIPKVHENLVRIEDTLEAFEKYSDTAMGGTGPFATWGGFKKWFDQETQKVDSKFRFLNIENMARMFDGMSRAVDSDTERRAWEATQAGITNDDAVNYEILLGSKALVLKKLAEADAQKEYVRQHGTIDDGYESPVYGKTTAVMGPNGEMELVPTDRLEEAYADGFVHIDQYSSERASGKRKRTGRREQSGRRQRQQSSDGKVEVFNPETGETLRIDPSDLPHAEADGFRRR